MASFYDFEAKSIDGENIPMSKYRGQVVLVVNVASKCGFTPQYEGLETLYGKFKDKGFVILGFPCNQFGAQEPGNEQEILQFCRLRYEVTFPMFAKVEVNGDSTHPLYAFLKRSARGVLGTTGIKWNFTKFLVARDGRVIDRFATATRPEELEGAIRAALAEDTFAVPGADNAREVEGATR